MAGRTERHAAATPSTPLQSAGAKVDAETLALLAEALERMGLLEGAVPSAVPLAGGVSSDIWRVDLRERSICIKRALAKLRVAADWRAPVGRNANEVAWLRLAGAVVPDAVPAVLGEVPDLGMFAMAWLDPASHPCWKQQLADGRAEPATAEAVGARLARIHAHTAGVAAVAERFAADDIFHDIRLDPYLLESARVHAEVAPALERLAADTLAGKRALVHGDVSPKNILVGPRGPVFIDAECAWYGDPAFDVAFCLNHLLLKCLWLPPRREAFLACFDALASAYLAGVTWEPAAAIEARAAALLPGLMLARVDGKSPVEYLGDEADRARVRRVSIALLRAPAATLAAVRAAWRRELGA
ncbi:MAG: phosphotransferase [Gammaproteobacteria bacterium]|nr:phosphotransferase [Gammaproteobacteria bacterium]